MKIKNKKSGAIEEITPEQWAAFGKKRFPGQRPSETMQSAYSIVDTTNVAGKGKVPEQLKVTGGKGKSDSDK